MTAISIDANIILRWLLSDVPAQTVLAEKLLSSHPVIVVSDAAIIETVFVLEKYYDLGRKDIVASIKAVMSLRNIRCSRDIINSVLDIYCERSAISFVDIYLALTANINKAIPLFTFDKKLAKIIPDTAKLLK